MKAVFAVSGFVAIWAACIIAGFAVPVIVGRNSVTAASYAMIFGGFGVMMGPVVAAIVIFPRLKRAAH